MAARWRVIEVALAVHLPANTPAKHDVALDRAAITVFSRHHVPCSRPGN
jgi:hypothetical protein